MAHLHSVYDGDTHFKINPITRKIENTTGKVILMQNDHNSERFTFEIPRYIDGHDMSLCNRVEVHYNNIDSKTKDTKKGVYEVTDLQVSPDAQDVVICSWLISGNATKYAGSLNFVLRYACLTEAIIDYQWFTDIYREITVSESISNTATVATEIADILAQWKAELEAAGGSAATPRIVNVELLASAWTGEDSPYSQIVNIDGITANSQVDLTPSVEQLAIFSEKDLVLVTENANGVVTAYAIGEKPKNDYLIQATVTEVKK